MAVVWHRELPRERSQSGKYQETYTYKRSWIVRVDAVDTPLPDITNAVGFGWRDEHPDDPSCLAMEFDTKATDESGLIYRVDVTYYTPPVDGGGESEPGSIPGFMRSNVWTGSSSAKTVPAVRLDGTNIKNSAGDPLEGLEMEITEPRLSLKKYYQTHGEVLTAQRDFSDTVNSGTWNGGAAETWRCLGCSFQPVTENVGGVSITLWEVNWEFAYDRTTWRLKPWDVGFAERCDSSGTASGSGSERKIILGQDKKPVRQPVALAGGVALPPGSEPEIVDAPLGVEVYEQADFGSAFGEVFTPLSV
jgi:hypothetical protein